MTRNIHQIHFNMMVFLIMVTYIPALSTWLPTLKMGPELIVR